MFFSLSRRGKRIPKCNSLQRVWSAATSTYPNPPPPCISQSMHRLGLYEDAARASAVNAALVRATKRLAQEVEVSKVVETLVRALRRLTRATRVNVYLVDADSEMVHLIDPGLTTPRRRVPGLFDAGTFGASTADGTGEDVHDVHQGGSSEYYAHSLGFI